MTVQPDVSQFNVSGTKQEHALHTLTESEYRHRQLVQNLAAAVYTCNAEGYITSYNKVAVDLWGREPELGKDLWCGSWKIFEPDGVTPMPLDTCPMAAALKEGRSVRGQEIIVERPDGIRRNVMPYPDPIFDSSGNVVEAVNMLVDITDIKQKENALRESEEKYKHISEQLEKLVEERTKDLKEANHTLQRINAELEQFAFVASHDMQEPLRKIKNFTHRLELKATALDDTAHGYLKKIKSSSERMTNLINDILNYSRLPHLSEQFVVTDLNEVLKTVLDDLELSLEQRKTLIHAEQLPVIKAIPLQMSQLFYNVIGNSLKFCKEDVPCELKITCKKLSAKEAGLPGTIPYYRIIIKDNGIGFKQEFSENIFKIFERLHTSQQYDGTGIGLALCKKIVTIHNGKIFAESQPDTGAAIHIILPAE